MNDSDNIVTIQIPDSSYLSWDDIDLSTVSVTSNTSSTVTIDTISFPNSVDWNLTEFEGIMPSVAKVNEMCKEYPALENAYENFKLIYKLVHDDWISKQENPNA